MTKAESIRQYLNKRPRATAREAVRGIKNEYGLDVSADFVNEVRKKEDYKPLRIWGKGGLAVKNRMYDTPFDEQQRPPSVPRVLEQEICVGCLGLEIPEENRHGSF